MAQKITTKNYWNNQAHSLYSAKYFPIRVLAVTNKGQNDFSKEQCYYDEVSQLFNNTVTAQRVNL